ncbi:CRISPR-associated endoribonuclease Cas6 [Alkaliphilus hydrothermalis]|uniref:CRISPR-associated endoribonuclease Cas6 n=1 Tax=Alkaliphilus hydrothermalis TaxID=1482730 RepID=A0ABS2NSS3_9FIRM|nr:CRISPR-associated endoribonuclease Cas6 [Alkaliphilus hydrothermalis]MBM7616005.1 CRISPR-associated endoribonuclease Cas6 [Alkaliphilus hydrothermalis]
MRFSVELILENEALPKDKNRIILSIMKSCFSSYNQEYYQRLYEEKESKNKIKDFTFALYMQNCRFTKDEIIIPDKKVILNFSAYSPEDGIMFYNSFLTNKGKKQTIHNNIITIGKMTLVKEKPIYDQQVIFKTLSPIVVREHGGDNKKTWYHSLETEEGQAIFMENLKYQLSDVFGERGLLDFEDIKVEVDSDIRKVKVKNYGIEVHSSIGKIRIKAQPYILDYLYKAGIGSKRGSGFGMVDIV